MGHMERKGQYGKPIDVICQHSTDGSVIPMRVRVRDEDGGFQTLNVKGYRDYSHNPEYKLPNGYQLTTYDFCFECNIVVFGMRKKIILFYRPQSDSVWRVVM